MIEIEVVYCAQPSAIDRVELALPDGSTLGAALAASGLLARHGFSEEAVLAGIWGRKQPLGTLLRSRDRVEIYRPLQCDPKEARRLRYRARAATKKQPDA